MSVESVDERRARWLSVGVSASALPSRRPQAAGELVRTKVWEAENAAYKECRRGGVQPESVASAPGMLEALNG